MGDFKRDSLPAASITMSTWVIKPTRWLSCVVIGANFWRKEKKFIKNLVQIFNKLKNKNKQKTEKG